MNMDTRRSKEKLRCPRQDCRSDGGGVGGDFEEITISILRGLRELSYKDWELAVVEKKWVKILEIKL